MFIGRIARAAIAAAVMLWPALGQAQTPEEFYRGNTVTLIISAAPGGAADLYGRAFAKFFGKHLVGNPDVRVTNLPGSGGLTAGVQLQNIEAKDGTVVGLLQNNNLYLPLVSTEKIEFDPRKVSWVGSFNKESHALIVWHEAPVKTIDDLFTVPLKIGSTSYSQINRTFPAIINDFLDTKMDIVVGYEGNEQIALAMERGEVGGRVLSVTSILGGTEAQWRADGKIRVIAQMAAEPNPAIPDVPMITDYLKNEKAKAVFKFMFLPLKAGRPLAAPKDVPADRLAALRAAFEATTADPDFRAELAKQNASVEMITGGEVEEIITTLVESPPDVIEYVSNLLKPQ